jgi:hypothetical protein
MRPSLRKTACQHSPCGAIKCETHMSHLASLYEYEIRKVKNL